MFTSIRKEKLEVVTLRAHPPSLSINRAEVETKLESEVIRNIFTAIKIISIRSF